MFTRVMVERYKYIVAILIGGSLGILQGVANSEGGNIDALAEKLLPFAYYFFGAIAIIGPFLKPPKGQLLFTAFASSLIVFSGLTSLVNYFRWDLSTLLGIMSAAAIGLGISAFSASIKAAIDSFSESET